MKPTRRGFLGSLLFVMAGSATVPQVLIGQGRKPAFWIALLDENKQEIYAKWYSRMPVFVECTGPETWRQLEPVVWPAVPKGYRIAYVQYIFDGELKNLFGAPVERPLYDIFTCGGDISCVGLGYRI